MYNLLESITFYPVRIDEIPNEELKKEIRDSAGLDDLDDVISLSGTDIEKYHDKFGYQSFGESINYNEYDFDELLLREELLSVIGNYPHYLVFASGCTWNGASGYKITEKIEETVYRDYDINLYVQKELQDRGIECIESSHDVPTGSTTYIVGITEEEYDKMYDADFSEIENFVKNIFS